MFLLVEELVGGVVGELELFMSGLEFDMLLMLILETILQIFNLLVQPVDMAFCLNIDLLAGVKQLRKLSRKFRVFLFKPVQILF